jgi:hypothetical protein
VATPTAITRYYASSKQVPILVSMDRQAPDEIKADIGKRPGGERRQETPQRCLPLT